MRTPAVMLLALASSLCLSPAARAQSADFTLDEGGLTQTHAPEPGSDDELMSRARAHLADGNPGKAKKLLTPWIEKHKRSSNPWLAQAYLLRGDARLAQGYEYSALFDYEAVAQNFPASEAFPIAVEREFDIARSYVRGLKRRLLGMRIESGRLLGEELLIRTQERLPGSELAEQAAIELADHYYTRREMKLASEMYSIFQANYPNSEHSEKAALREIECNIARFKGPRYDGSGLLEARLLVEDYRRDYPAKAERTGVATSLLHWIDESAALQRLDTAQWYLRTHDEPAARLVLRRLLREHPQSAAARSALELMTDRGWIEAPEVTTPTSRVAPDAVTPAQSNDPNGDP